MLLPSTRRAPGRGPQVRAYPAMSWSWTRLSPGPTGQPAPEPSPQAQVTQARWSPGRAAANRRQLSTRDPTAAPPLLCGRLACHTGMRQLTEMRCGRTPRRGKPAEPREAPPGPRAGGMAHPSVERAETPPLMAPAGPVRGGSAPETCALCWASGGRLRPRSTRGIHRPGLSLGGGPPDPRWSTPRRGQLALGPVRTGGCLNLRATPGATPSAGWGPVQVATATHTTPAPRRWVARRAATGAVPGPEGGMVRTCLRGPAVHPRPQEVQRTPPEVTPWRKPGAPAPAGRSLRQRTRGRMAGALHPQVTLSVVRWGTTRRGAPRALPRGWTLVARTRIFFPP